MVGHMTMDDAIRVVHVVLSMDVGGLERVVLDLVGEGYALGQQPLVVCLERPGTLAPMVEALGSPVICLNKQPGTRLGLIGRIKTVFSGLGPDVVHTHQIGALFYAGPAARRAAVPLVVHTEHGKHYATRLRTRLLGRLAARYASRFFCVSEDIAAEVLACRITKPSKVAIARNGIDIGRFTDPIDKFHLRQSLGLPLECTIIGTVGRLSEIKRQDLLISAFAAVRRRAPDAHLLVVGDGPMMADLRSLAASLGLAHCVHFPGYQAQTHQYLQAMDIFALTSRSEGMPLVLLEAWAAGLPVVASRVGGLPELIQHDHNGLLFESGDQASLVAALGRLLSDRMLAARMGQAGRQLVEANYHRRKMAADYHRQYLQLLAQNSALA
jgi:sugar transferase (PEP-CTERM/EpsH1 system associated)